MTRTGEEESCHQPLKVVFLEHTKITYTIILPPFPDMSRDCGEGAGWIVYQSGCLQMVIPSTIHGRQKTHSTHRHTCTSSICTFCLPRSQLKMNRRSQTASGPKTAKGHERALLTHVLCATAPNGLTTQHGTLADAT